jgi:glutamate dehydrogenase (NAD(P)+)
LDSVETSIQKAGLKTRICPNKGLKDRIYHTTEADYVASGLESIIELAGLHIMQTANKYNLCLDLRTAAYITSIMKIYKKCEIAGLSM